ncbi:MULTISPECIES: GNAT family N-acetyltransferase [unclassified Knoellia]|uniref:GNAT family N-acetyltransferase n=1 Tax=Knoellia altitudinis TaxID=3404795 RepID=UPI0036189B5E
MTVSARPGYRFIPTAPSPEAYCELRRAAGLSPKTLAQASAAIPGSWAACHVVHEPTGDAVAMGRVIGDGGWYFHIADMATHPDHQRLGLGARVMEWLLDSIRAAVEDEPYVTLMADEPGRPLYRRFGFQETAPTSIGMKLTTL